MKHNILGERKHLCFYLFLENEIKIRYIFLRIKNFSWKNENKICYIFKNDSCEF